MGWLAVILVVSVMIALAAFVWVCVLIYRQVKNGIQNIETDIATSIQNDTSAIVHKTETIPLPLPPAMTSGAQMKLKFANNMYLTSALALTAESALATVFTVIDNQAQIDASIPSALRIPGMISVALNPIMATQSGQSFPLTLTTDGQSHILTAPRWGEQLFVLRIDPTDSTRVSGTQYSSLAAALADRIAASQMSAAVVTPDLIAAPSRS